MTGKKSYNRYFIIFQEEDRGFGIALDKQPTGYTKIETRNGKCKVTVYVQNLVKEKGPYLCCLIDGTKNPAVVARLGEIAIDDTGRGETWWEFKEDDIAGTGMSVDRFGVAAVIIDGNVILAPLAGYAGKDKVEWKSRMAKKPAQVEKVKVEEEKRETENETAELNEEAKKFKEYEESIKEDVVETNKENEENIKEDVVETGSVPAEEKMDEENRDEIRTLEDSGKVEEDVNPDKNIENISAEETGKENIEDDYSEVVKKYDVPSQEVISQDLEENEDEEDVDYDLMRHKKDCHDHDKKEKKTYAKIFHNLLEEFEEIEDLAEEFKGCRWWKIPLEDKEYIREDSYYPYHCAIHHLKMAYPYINYVRYFKRTGYYYFGIRYDDDGEVKAIMYGIEGRYSTDEQPYMGMTGFAKWFKLKNSDRGMWVMFYNPYTGCIMIPKRK